MPGKNHLYHYLTLPTSYMLLYQTLWYTTTTIYSFCSYLAKGISALEILVMMIHKGQEN